MNGLDIFICIFVAIGLFRGVARGLIKEVASIAGVFAGFYVALAHYGSVTPLFSQYIERPEMANLVGFFLLFFGVLIGVAAVGAILKYILKITHLGNVDKVFGAILGLFKGVLVSAAVVFAFTIFLPVGKTGLLDRSLLAPTVTKTSKVIVANMPDDLMQGFHQKAALLKEKWEASDK
ncbi:MAG: CvpA family protein [Desulfatibacillum sp.]|nr:CvpA family protein [Desulfatibacillum sp.]